MRLQVRLDSRIALEAIILNRYERVPESRRAEWLRRLLVQGFLSECSAVRSVQERPKRSGKKELGDWLAQASKGQPVAGSPPETRPRSQPAFRTEGKPLAALRGVIGGLAALAVNEQEDNP